MSVTLHVFHIPTVSLFCSHNEYSYFLHDKHYTLTAGVWYRKETVYSELNIISQHLMCFGNIKIFNN